MRRSSVGGAVCGWVCAQQRPRCSTCFSSITKQFHRNVSTYSAGAAGSRATAPAWRSLASLLCLLLTPCLAATPPKPSCCCRSLHAACTPPQRLQWLLAWPALPGRLPCRCRSCACRWMGVLTTSCSCRCNSSQMPRQRSLPKTAAATRAQTRHQHSSCCTHCGSTSQPLMRCATRQRWSW